MTALTTDAMQTGIVCENLSAADKAQLHDAARSLLRARGMVVRLTEFLTRCMEALAGRTALHGLGELQARLRGPVEQALWHGYRVATFGLDRGGITPWSRSRRLMASASGAMSGLAGLPGAAVDLPFTTAMMLRAIAEIARAHGEDIRDPETRRACIEVFTLGSVPGEDSDAEVSYWAARATLNHTTVAATIQQAARLLVVPLSEKLLAQAVPIAGAFAGGTLNYAFMRYFQQIAQVHFAVRALERRTGDSALVRACLHEFVARQRVQS